MSQGKTHIHITVSRLSLLVDAGSHLADALLHHLLPCPAKVHSLTVCNKRLTCVHARDALPAFVLQALLQLLQLPIHVSGNLCGDGFD